VGPGGRRVEQEKECRERGNRDKRRTERTSGVGGGRARERGEKDKDKGRRKNEIREGKSRTGGLSE
jgi:hypothetical protein